MFSAVYSSSSLPPQELGQLRHKEILPSCLSLFDYISVPDRREDRRL